MSFYKINIKFCIALLIAIAGFEAAHAMPTDSDGDAIYDTADNCINVANPGQEDTDGDGHGNICDGDFDNTCGPVDFTDLALFKAAFFAASPLHDFNSSGGPVDFTDLAIFKGLVFQDPGPSAPGALCNPDADNDGVADADDLCPGTPPGSTVDADGCVIAPQLIPATATASSPPVRPAVQTWPSMATWQPAGNRHTALTPAGSRSTWVPATRSRK